VEQLAGALGVTKGTAYAYLHNGLLPGYRLGSS
jgi:excisionase family DNA binding protein